MITKIRANISCRLEIFDENFIKSEEVIISDGDIVTITHIAFSEDENKYKLIETSGRVIKIKISEDKEIKSLCVDASNDLYSNISEIMIEDIRSIVNNGKPMPLK